MKDDKIVHDSVSAELEKSKMEEIPAEKDRVKKSSLFEKDPGFNLWWVVLYLGLIAGFAVLGAYTGLFVARYKILDVEQAVANHKQSITTTILDGGGQKAFAELAEERRILLSKDEIPANFINAAVSIEDREFFKHPGVDLLGISRAFWVNLTKGRVVQGGSTISQQLIKNLFLSSEQSYTRKIKEAILALQLEAKYTKEEIFAFYCNTIYLGHNRNGLEAASRYYFGVHASEMSLQQAAMLAGIIRGPEIYTPIKHPDRALRRRNLVLEKMAENGFITARQLKEAKEAPLGLRERTREKEVGEFYKEEVRRFLVQKYGREQTLGGGLNVYTTIETRLQAAAEDALRQGLMEGAKRQKMRPISENVLAEGHTVEAYFHPDWNEPLQEGRYITALITNITRNEKNTKAKDTVTVRIGQHTATFDRTNVPTRMLTREENDNLGKVFKVGDLLPVEIQKLKITEIAAEEKEKTPEEKLSDGAETELQGQDSDPKAVEVKVEIQRISISQKPTTAAALVAIEAQTGRVLAMVGGYDITESQFNNATQAVRQPGSAFKPFIACAAIENNKATLGSTIFDEPTVFDDPGAPELYEPANYHNEYVGITTVRDLLEKSRNVPAVKLMLHTGIKETVEVLSRLGLKNMPTHFSLALGSEGVTLMDIVAAYSVFPNQGVVIKPHLISRVEDARGNILFQDRSRPQTALKPSTAFLVTQALIGVFERGTAKGAKWIMDQNLIPLGGKTGTTDDYRNAWFLGFSPQIVCGVWVGNSDFKPIGNGETGAITALPIWERFMSAALEDPKWREIKDYQIPPNVQAVQIDRRNGLLASHYTPTEEIIIEFFIRGTEPSRSTTYEDDYNLRIAQPHLMEKKVDITFDGDSRVSPKDVYDIDY